MASNWTKIKNEYATTNISYRALALKHKVSFASLRFNAEKEHWTELRKTHRHKFSTKLAQKTVDTQVNKEIDRISRISSIADRLIDKMERAIDELDRAIVSNKKKTKIVEYNHDVAIGKPTKEVIEETETLVEVTSIIDRAGLKQLSSALKDLKDIQVASSASTSDNTKLDDVLKAVTDVN